MLRLRLLLILLSRYTFRFRIRGADTEYHVARGVGSEAGLKVFRNRDKRFVELLLNAYGCAETASIEVSGGDRQTSEPDN